MGVYQAFNKLYVLYYCVAQCWRARPSYSMWVCAMKQKKMQKSLSQTSL